MAKQNGDEVINYLVECFIHKKVSSVDQKSDYLWNYFSILDIMLEKHVQIKNYKLEERLLEIKYQNPV